MALFPVKPPPGVVRYGTESGSVGRYYDAWHVRWEPDGTLKPTKGWLSRASSSVTGKARALYPWKDNADLTWLAIGTHSKLYVQNRAGTNFDITPSGMTTGRADAVTGGGYGRGLYGRGTYGTPRVDDTIIQMATQWTLDNFGQNLVACNPDDGKIYEWVLNTSNPATQVTDSPTCKAIVVTAERFLFALGSTNQRTITWCDQEDDTEWTPDATNQAGDIELQTAGAIMCGKRIKGGTLIFTDLDVHLATYIGGTLVYSFDPVGTGCGIVSRQAVAAIDAQAVWMSKSGFWLFNGYTQPLGCELQDYVFSDINALQISKTYAVRDGSAGEVQFYYCSGSSNEIDRCVIWNYKYNYWNIGRVARTCGADRGVFTYPIYLDSSGATYEHETGFAYGSEDLPYAEGGPIQIGNGDNVVRVDSLIPDEQTQGDVTVTFKTKFYPNGTETTYGAYDMNSPRSDGRVDVRFTSRQAKIRIEGDTASDWRFGGLRLNGTLGGGR